MVSASVFSLNSSFFRAMKVGSPRLIPVVRSAVLARPCDLPHAIGPGLRTYRRGFDGEARVRLEVIYLRCRRRQVTACGRSVLRDLNCPAAPETLRRMGWLKREAFMLSLPPRPLPPNFVSLGVPTLPTGWRRVPVSRKRGVRRRQKAAEECFLGLLTSAAWTQVVPSKVLKQKTWARTTSTGASLQWRWWRRNSQGRPGASRFRAGSEFLKFSARLRLPVGPVYDYCPQPGGRKVWSGGGGVPDSVDFVPASTEGDSSPATGPTSICSAEIPWLAGSQ